MFDLWLTRIPLFLAGEKNTDQNKQLGTSGSNSVVYLKVSEPLRGKRTTAPASVLPPSGLQDGQTQPAKPTNASRLFLGNSLPARAQSHPGTLRVAREEDPLTDGGPFLTTDLIQHLGVKGAPEQQLVPVSPLKEKNGGWQREERPALFSRRSPSFKIIPNRRMTAGKRRRSLFSSWAGATFVDDSDSENRDPEPEGNLPGAARLKDFNQTASGFCRKYSDAVSYENSSLASTQWLFTQDSEGYRVISHCCGEESKRSSPKKLLWGKKTPVRSSFDNKSCFRDGWAGDSSPAGSLGRSPSPLAERSESCYDLLFTEDSEGNKVIKH